MLDPDGYQCEQEPWYRVASARGPEAVNPTDTDTSVLLATRP